MVGFVPWKSNEPTPYQMFDKRYLFDSCANEQLPKDLNSAEGYARGKPVIKLRERNWKRPTVPPHIARIRKRHEEEMILNFEKLFNFNASLW